MLYKIRLGDILLAENKQQNMTNMYLITYDSLDGFVLMCLACGEQVGCYKHNRELLEKDIKGLLSVKQIIPKEIIVDFVNKTYKPNLPVRSHDTYIEDHELGIEVEL